MMINDSYEFECPLHLTKKAVWAYSTSVTPPLVIEVPVLTQERYQSCISVLVVFILHLSTIFLSYYANVPTWWYYCFSFYETQI